MDYEVLVEYEAYAGALGSEEEEVPVVALKLISLESAEAEEIHRTFILAAEDAVKVGFGLVHCAEEILSFMEETDENETEDA